MGEKGFENEKDEEGTAKLEAPPDFDGPVSNRRCTDVLCLALIWIAWGTMSALGAYAVTNGDYRVVLRPMDYDGNICGTDYGPSDMTNYSYLYYVNSYSGGVCVEECPQVEGLADVYTAVTYGGVRRTEMSTVPPDAIKMADYSYTDDALTCSNSSGMDTCYPFGDARLSWTAPAFNRGWGYAYYALDTTEVLWRCVPNPRAIERLREETSWPDEEDGEGTTNRTDATNRTGAAGAEALAVSDGGSFWTNLYGDLWTARHWILGFGFGVSLVVGFLYAFFLRVPGILPVMVWGSMLATIAAFFGVGVQSYRYADRKSSEEPATVSDELITGARIAAYVLWALGALFFVLMCLLRKQIGLAMGCVKEASRSVSAMPALILFPVLQAGGFILFMVAFFYYGIHLASMGELRTKEYTVDSPFGDAFSATITVRDFEYGPFVERSAWFLLFCFYWTSQFILSMGEIVVAMAVGRWYFTRDKSTVGSATVFSSICASCYYHTGTAAFGSLIIAIIKIIRTIIAKLQKKAEQMNSQVAKVLLCCCQCCMWCFEKCVKFINKNAYIQTAVFGTSFCTSAKNAFFLILRNAARISAISFVSTGIIFVGRLFIMAVTCGASYYALDTHLEGQLHSPVGPVVFVALIGYFVGGMFMSVFDMGISTVLQCFVADEEMFGSGGEGACYAEGKLRKWIDEAEEEGSRVVVPKHVTKV